MIEIRSVGPNEVPPIDQPYQFEGSTEKHYPQLYVRGGDYPTGKTKIATDGKEVPAPYGTGEADTPSPTDSNNAGSAAVSQAVEVTPV